MKQFTYSFSNDDVRAILSSLLVMAEVLPGSDLVPPEVVKQSLYYGEQAVDTLANAKTQISYNQLSSIHVALQLADGINCNEIPVDDVSKKRCQDSFFRIRHLLYVFDEYFSD